MAKREQQKKFPQRKKNRLALRAGIIYFGIPALVIAILLLIGGNIINVISDDFSRRLARQYSIEAAANFITATNSHFVLAQQLAHSTAISRWMVYGDDEGIRARAIEEIIGYAAFAPHVFLMFSSYESLDVYDLRVGFAEEDFVPWWQIEENRALWFFEARDAKLPFSLNIQRTRPVDDRFDIYVWTNHRMYYQNRFVGIVTAGSPFQSVFDAVFGGYDAAHRRGYIIDYSGMVRVDSAELLKVFYEGWSHPAVMPEAIDNPALTDGINAHLQTKVGGAFQLGVELSDTIPIHGDFRYASIAPIIGTNWSVVVLSSHAGFDMQYMFAISSIFAVLIISVLIGNLLMRRIALVPLYKLTKSTASASLTEDTELFGLERDDEIGDLARSIKESRKTLEHRERMLNTVNQAAQILLTSNEDSMKAVAKGMEIVGRNIGATRVHLWRNEMIDGELHFALKHNWVIEGDDPKKEIYVGMSFPYRNRPGWLEMLTRGERINSPVFKLPPENTNFLTEYDIKSIAIQPLLINNELFGSLSVSDCQQERVFTDNEMEMLASTGLMFANALIRSEQETAIKEALEAERDTHEFNKAILDAAPLVIGLWTEDGKPVAGNKQTLDFFGVHDSQIVTDNLYAYSPEFQPCGTPTPTKASMYYQKAFKEGYVRFEWLHKRSDGELIPTECIYKTYKSKGKTMLLSYTIDLREVKKAMAEMQRIEVAEESNKAKSRFLARMSHEIRTPLTAILGISEIQLRSPTLSRHTGEAFSKVYDSAQLLLNIVNDILDFSKIESGKMPIAEQVYEVASLANDVAQLHIVHLEHKNITFQMHIDEQLPALLIGDMLRIRQIINNLISNAFKYTEFGSVSLSLECEKIQSDSVMLAITVRDTGFGMSEEQLEAAKANEYSRFHEAEERFISGTGLGIPIVHSLVEMMNGQIHFESDLGKGTKVVVSIPQKTCGAQALGKETAARLENFDIFSGQVAKKSQFVPEPMPYGKVLVVDDVDANLFVARGFLSFYDLSVETCLSGQDAIDKIDQGIVYDIIFMDYLMPALNGIETMHIMREMGYKHPIVALTANALVGQAEEFMENGFDDFLSKPIQTVRLNEVLTKFIRNKQPPEVIAAAIAEAKAKPPVRRGGIENFLGNAAVAEKLRIEFARNHKKSFENISQSLEAGDIKAAHLLAHTIKSSAGLIGEDSLAEAAKAAENLLRDGKTPDNAQLSALKNELARVLEKISVQETPPHPADNTFEKSKAIALLDELKLLLDNNNTDSLNLSEELRVIPEAAIIVRQIEEFEFEAALKSINVLRDIWEE